MEVLATLAQGELGKDERWHSTAPGDRERLVAAALKQDSEQRSREAAAATRAFRVLLQERLLGPASIAGREPPTFGEARRLLRGDPRWKAVASVAERQQLYGEAASDASRQCLRRRQRQAEDEDELMERRKRSRRAQAEAEFRGILTSHVKSLLQVSWAEARVLLDGVGGPAELDEAGRERVFEELRRAEAQERVAAFADVLRHASADFLGLEACFEDAYAAVLSKLGGEVQVQGVSVADLRRTWETWRRAKLTEAVEIFNAWLLQCEHFAKAAKDPEAHSGRGPLFEALCGKLAGDPRYLRLNVVPEKRRGLIMARLRQVASLQ
mmetsp:Transcript_110151/g.355543  ORF Transcript_110151/g.355543 Transcript_110151/m.355543 type:complete len:325 (-) Transcript_110151:84-1058(-)